MILLPGSGTSHSFNSRLSISMIRSNCCRCDIATCLFYPRVYQISVHTACTKKIRKNYKIFDRFFVIYSLSLLPLPLLHYGSKEDLWIDRQLVVDVQNEFPIYKGSALGLLVSLKYPH